LMLLEDETNQSNIYFIPIKSDLLISKEIINKLSDKKIEKTKIDEARKEILFRILETAQPHHKQPYIFLSELFEKVNLKPEKVFIEFERLAQGNNMNTSATLCNVKKSYLRYNKGGESKTIPFDYEIALILAFLKDLEVYLKDFSFNSEELI
ncbi:MAG: hypothetical protein QXL86_03890, partial [Candidatus Aenigmatarchaeota archaeon]